MTRLTAAEKVRRDALVVADRARGLKWSTVAERHGLSMRQCQEIVKAHREVRPSMLDRDPVEAVEQALDEYDDLVERLALLADASTHEAVKLGALKAQHRVVVDRLQLMTAVGLLPRDLGLIHHDLDLRRTTEIFIEVMSRYGLGEDAEDDLLQSLQPHVPVLAGPFAA